jgi:hypothetical protein
LPARQLTHKPLCGLGVNGHYGRSRPASFFIFNYFRFPGLHNCHRGVGRTQVDSDRLRHVSVHSSSVFEFADRRLRPDTGAWSGDITPLK